MTREDFVSDLNVRLELVGMPAFLSPFLHKISTQRAAMFSAHGSQAMVVYGA